MKKILITLMMVFGLSVAAFADVKLVPKDTFNNFVSVLEGTGAQPLIAYVADTWEDVYEKTGVGKYDWTGIDSAYCVTEQSYTYLIIIKLEIDRGYLGWNLGWICIEYPGDGSSVLYTADVEY